MRNHRTSSKFETISISDPSVRLCFRRGFLPIDFGEYIDDSMIRASGFDKLVIIPEIESISMILIESAIEQFNNYYEENGDLPGKILQNMATWMLAWGLEMAWRWKNGTLEDVVFMQDMNSLDVPKSKFELMPRPWYSAIIDSFIEWSYTHPGYTDQYELDIYDPIRDGYLTIIRCVITKVIQLL